MIARLTSFLRSLPRAIIIAAGVLVLTLLVAAAIYGYRVYNYVQHDNDFCMSCHLMVDPYQRFARSGHRGLGCKACHQPTPLVRAKMGLTQIVRNPKQLEAHAEVPNARCEACHVKGNPAEWTIISQSAGHRVHFESNALVLRGLQCVQCHSSSVHEFATTDKTCGQAGCHENVTIHLGKMSKLTLHCAVCHDFTRPVAASSSAQDTISALLRPQATECLSCHAMRQRFKMPENDPHNGACGACHNPHEQLTPREAVKSCGKAGCHESAQSISPMHKGLTPGQLEDCAACHKAHEFRIAAQQCAGCHKTVPETKRFPHARHAALQCSACHTTDASHGELKLNGPKGCQNCHHNSQLAANCTSCHRTVDFRDRKYSVTQSFTMSVGNRTRALTFDHRAHANVACTQCHTDTQTRSAAKLDCRACHAQHHQPTVSCMACHPPVTGKAHNRNVHVGCSGSSCHKLLPAPVANVPHTRQFCLTCHQSMVSHQPQGNCANCHMLPPPRGGAR